MALFICSASCVLYSAGSGVKRVHGFFSGLRMRLFVWPSNRATEGSNPMGTRLYFVILLKNVEKIFDWH